MSRSAWNPGDAILVHGASGPEPMTPATPPDAARARLWAGWTSLNAKLAVLGDAYVRGVFTGEEYQRCRAGIYAEHRINYPEAY